MRKRIYIAWPISKPATEEGLRHNVAQADDAMLALLKAGYAPFNPMLSVFAGGVQQYQHGNGEVFALAHRHANNGFREVTHAEWLEMDLAWVSVADGVLRLPGESVGADTETGFAQRNRTPVFHSIDTLRYHFEVVVEPGEKGPGWWDQYFLGLAEYVSKASKDPSTKVGCVIVDADRRVVSTAFNGFARGCSDDPAIYADRDRKIRRVVHSEPNAIVFAKQDLKGCTMYTVPFSPCSQCAALIIQAGIKRVVSIPCSDPARAERWKADMAEAREQFAEAGVQLDLIG